MINDALYIKSSVFIQSTYQTKNFQDLDLPGFFFFLSFWKCLVLDFITWDPHFLLLCVFDFTACAKPGQCLAFFCWTCNECMCVGRPLATA